jgi:murein DD-endopeptidase MepM/ murein hydrolase activator NlpD
MKNRFLDHRFLIFPFLFFQQILLGQYSKVEEISLFGTRINSPVAMDVQRSDNKITFDAISKSYFTYNLTINFNNLTNLSPKIFDYHTKIHFGRNRLFVLDVIDKSQSFDYRYSFNYSLEIPNKPDLNFPYLIPIGNGKVVKLHEIKKENNTTYFLNQFNLQLSDTVYAARKGIITALPDNKTEVERIYKSSSLEVLHSDGTISIYIGLDPDTTFLKLGQTIYPGQPVGIMGSSEILTLHVVVPKEAYKLEDINFFYSDQNGDPISALSIRNLKAIYPKNIIQKELTSRELKKYQKGNLFK